MAILVVTAILIVAWTVIVYLWYRLSCERARSRACVDRIQLSVSVLDRETARLRGTDGRSYTLVVSDYLYEEAQALRCFLEEETDATVA